MVTSHTDACYNHLTKLTIYKAEASTQIMGLLQSPRMGLSPSMQTPSSSQGQGFFQLLLAFCTRQKHTCHKLSRTKFNKVFPLLCLYCYVTGITGSLIFYNSTHEIPRFSLQQERIFLDYLHLK